MFNLQLGDDVDTKAASDDCFALSGNFVLVNRRAPSPFQVPAELSTLSNNAKVQSSQLVPVPNPVRETLNLNLDWRGPGSAATLVVRDLTGRVISSIQTEIYAGQNTISLPTNEWPLGVLQIVLLTKTETISTKIVKVN
jgi:hypothetical protein